MTLRQTLVRLKQADDQRSSFAGEHWLVLGLGMMMLVMSTRGRSPITRRLGTTIGYGLLARAASGRDGLRSVLGRPTTPRR